MDKLTSGTIKSIAKTSPTADEVLHECADRERFREMINLKKFKYDMIKKGRKVVDSDYLDTFKKLEKAGVGSLIRGRDKGDPIKFAWNYNLRAVGKAALAESDQDIVETKKVLTPSKPLDKHVTKVKEPAQVQLVINFSTKADKKDIEALLELARELGK